MPQSRSCTPVSSIVRLATSARLWYFVRKEEFFFQTLVNVVHYVPVTELHCVYFHTLVSEND